jgi:glutamine amidotransferase
MCRMAAYVGPTISLEQFLLKPAHSLVVQSYQPRELRYAKLNADGYGVGWYAPDGNPAVYTNPMPIWSDVNLPHLGRTLSTDLWMANVRSATAGLPACPMNTQPFWDEELLFMHNGLIKDFALSARTAMRQFLDPTVEAQVHGNTDSEYLFAVLRHLLLDDEELAVEEAISELFSLAEDWVGEREALLNLVVSDGDRIYATRHALNHEAPSLYYTTDDEQFPGGQVVASEALSETGVWQAVPEHNILILDPEEPPELLAL